MAPPEKYYNPTQVAEQLSFQPEHIRVLCRKYEADKIGGLRHVKVPGPRGRIRIPESAITEWAKRNTYHPGVQ